MNSKRVIKKREIGEEIYELCFVPQPPITDEPYVIYRWGKGIKFDRLPEVKSFNNEKDAIEYFDEL